jgi:Cellulase (glycosyl hydrolase family 5)
MVGLQSFVASLKTKGASYTGTIKIVGNQFNNGISNIILRGANATGFVYTIPNQYANGIATPTALYRGVPNFDNLASSWRMNVVRINVNESCWLGGTWYDGAGTAWNSDPSNDYKQGLDTMIAAANAAGIYVVIDLQWAMPGRIFSTSQYAGAPNYDNSPSFWASVAARYKNNPSVIFDLFNEPFSMNQTPSSPSNWPQIFMGTAGSAAYVQTIDSDAVTGNHALRTFPVSLSSITGTFKLGETITGTGLPAGAQATWVDTTPGALRMFIGYLFSGTVPSTYPICSNGITVTGATSGATAVISNSSLGWRVAGYQDLINAVRSAGSKAPCILGSASYSADLSNWLSTVASDATAPTGYQGTWVSQIGASWHPYSPEGQADTVSIFSAGTGHAVGDIIQMAPWLTYTAATIQILSVSGGAITGASAFGGTGYHRNEVLTTEFSVMIVSTDASGGNITAVRVVYGGYGYTVGQQFTSQGVTVTVASVSSGKVTGVTLTNGGGDVGGYYQVYDIITFNTANCAKFVVRQVNASGAITSLQVIQGGSGFATLTSFAAPITFLYNQEYAPTQPLAVKVTSVGTNGVITGVSLYDSTTTFPATYAGHLAVIAPVFNLQTDYSGAISAVPQWSTTGSGTGASFSFTTTLTINGGYNMPSSYYLVSSIMAAGYPFMTGEFGSYTYNYGCIGDAPDSILLDFLDSVGASYMAWIADSGIPPRLITNNTTNAPADGFGNWYQQHLQSIFGSPEVGKLAAAFVSSGIAANVNSSNYDQPWVSPQANPSVGSPDTITLDLTPIATQCRQTLVVNLISQKLTGWIHTGDVNLPANYTIWGNAASASAGVPSSGWVQLLSITGNTYQTRQHTLSTAGYNSLQIVITATQGNGATTLKVRLYDATSSNGSGLLDGIAWCGDTISANSLNLSSPISTGGYATAPSLGQYLGGGTFGYAEPGNAAITNVPVVQTITSTTYNFATTSTTALNSSSLSVTKGQVLLVRAGAPSASFNPTISDTQNLTWIKLGTATSNNTTVTTITSQAVAWYAVVNTSGFIVVTVSNSAENVNGFRLTVFNGAGTPRLVNSGNVMVNNTATAITQAVTPTSTGSALFLWVAVGHGDGSTIPATAGTGNTAVSSAFNSYYNANYEVTPTTNPLTSNSAFTLSVTTDATSSQNVSWLAIEVPCATIVYTNAITVPSTGYNPLQENHGIPATATTDWLASGGNGNSYLSLVLNNTNSKYVVLALGSYDAVNGVTAATYSANMLSLCQQCWAANRIVIIPTVPYSTNTTYNALITQYNTAIAALITAHPQIYAGPDYYSFFSNTNFQSSGQNNTVFISSTDVGGIGGNGLVPNTVGSVYYRMLAAQWFANNVYVATSL